MIQAFSPDDSNEEYDLIWTNSTKGSCQVLDVYGVGIVAATEFENTLSSIFESTEVTQ